LRTDIAVEGLFALLKEDPLVGMRLSARMLVGRKRAVAMLEQCRDIDAANLPYDPEIIERIEAERRNGTPIFLVSNEYSLYARTIARHLNLFDRVVTPEAGAPINSSSRDALTRESIQDCSQHAGNGHTRSKRYSMSAWIGAVRLHQWLKNLLIFVPLFASHWVSQRTPLMNAMLAFLLFGLCASSVYLLNDLFDLNDDRHHPTKRFRALADGRIHVRAALLVIPTLFFISMFAAYWFLPWQFCFALVAYYVTTLAYSLALKRVMMLDVVVLAMLYTLRVIAGTFAIKGNLTFWMLAFSLFIFMSLALAKRYAELIGAHSAGISGKVRGRGYVKADLHMISSLGASSGYISVLILALYIQDKNTTTLYSHPKLIWLACPLLLFWIGRTWMLTHRGQMHDDPLVFAIRDRVSLAIAGFFALVFVLAA
jgi:4-hydroxybenzoate polyprenyltransferase